MPYQLLAEQALATPNYSYEKRQRELAKKRKAEEKRQRKQSRGDGQEGAPEGGEAPADENNSADTPSPQDPV